MPWPGQGGWDNLVTGRGWGGGGQYTQAGGKTGSCGGECDDGDDGARELGGGKKQYAWVGGGRFETER